MDKPLNIVFFGTPEFATGVLETLHNSHHQIVAVVTAVDKPAGRGQKLNESHVKQFAVKNNIPVLQPSNLKAPEFIEELKSYKADLQVIVAFRMLPKVVWSMPAMGTFNLHASLLPEYRGAAPINWAIINQDSQSGVTTFLLTKK
ncbi:methionyl-tRNA formyltransferase [Nonlabens ulvanivorans]|nr:methionyl-tRNA formyltransferase [Nonlabens ulvanivorans]